LQIEVVGKDSHGLISRPNLRQKRRTRGAGSDQLPHGQLTLSVLGAQEYVNINDIDRSAFQKHDCRNGQHATIWLTDDYLLKAPAIAMTIDITVNADVLFVACNV
jgi:hypothetical protein